MSTRRPHFIHIRPKVQHCIGKPRQRQSQGQVIVSQTREAKMFRNWIIQKGDNVVIDNWCSCCAPEEEECSPRFFVIDDPQRSRAPRTTRDNYILCACYASGNSDYAIGETYLKRTIDLKVL